MHSSYQKICPTPKITTITTACLKNWIKYGRKLHIFFSGPAEKDGSPKANRLFLGLLDAKEIRTASANLGHTAIIDTNPRGGEKIPMEPAQARPYNERSASERIFAYLENYGAYTFRVRGAAKVMCHLMFAVLALTAQ